MIIGCDIIYNESFDYTLDGLKESRIRLSITESTFNHQYKKSLNKNNNKNKGRRKEENIDYKERCEN